MSHQGGSFKSCVPVSDAAKSLEIDLPELFYRASLGNLVVGMRDYGAAHLAPPPIGSVPADYDGDPMQCMYVGLLTLTPDDLDVLATQGEVIVESASLHRKWGQQTVVFDQPRKVTVADMVVPSDEVKNSAAQSKAENPESPISDKVKATLLKQIGALAMVIAKTRGGMNWGKDGLNAKAISGAVQDTLDQMPVELSKKLDTHGLSSASLRNSITAGLKLIEDK